MAELIQQGQEVDNKDEYVKRLSVACCSKGSQDFRQYLNLPKDHGVYFQDEEYPLMNANDHHGKEHIMHFGRCQSESNPKNIISDVMGKLYIAGALVNAVKDAVGSSGCKCCPKTLRSWEVENKENHLDGAPAVARSSELVCVYGGIITITDEPDTSSDDDTQSTPEETPEETNILDTLPANMANKIQQMNSNADAMAAEAMEWYAENADALMQLYGCTDAMSAQNYSNNVTQMIPMECMNEAGYITDVSGLTNFNMAGSNVASIGSGCVAAFNVLQALGSPMGLADVIMGMEQQQTINGFVDQGPVGVSMCGIASMLMGQGYAVDMLFPTELSMDTFELQEGEVALIGASSKFMMAEEPMFVEESMSLQQGDNALISVSNRGKQVSHNRVEPRHLSIGLTDDSVKLHQGEKSLISASKKGMKVGKTAHTDFSFKKKGITRRESLCTIMPGKKGMICAEQMDRPIKEVFMEKADSTLMIMKAKKG